MIVPSTLYSKVARTIDSSSVLGDNTAASQVNFEFLDLPKLDNEATDYIYFAACGKSWSGCNLYKTNDGSTYSLLAQSSVAATIGYTTTKLSEGPQHYFDNANTVDVVMVNGTLDSRPEIDVLNGYNAAVIGNEIVQFKTATLTATNTYRLSGLLRGRLGTEDQITEHVIGDRFVLLSTLSLGKITSADWYIDKEYKAGPTAESVDDITYVDITFTNNARLNQPFAVCHVNGERNTDGDLIVNWIRRTRFNGEWKDLSDAPLNETSEQYSIDVMSGTAIKRTITTTSPTLTYTAAMQIADFGSLQAAITLQIYQVSETRGRGIKKEVTL